MNRHEARQIALITAGHTLASQIDVGWELVADAMPEADYDKVMHEMEDIVDGLFRRVHRNGHNIYQRVITERHRG